MKILITGATGFVGQELCRVLTESGHNLRLAVRQDDDRARALARITSSQVTCVGNIGPETDWGRALEGVDVVVHLAALVHQLDSRGYPSLEAFRSVNCHGTSRLARCAAEAGVPRFVFLSTIKVNGELTVAEPFTEESEPAPADSYGVSKWEAEQALGRISRDTGLEVVIFRPPLIYGPGVKGNFLSLMTLVRRGMPLPFGLVHNKRSLLYVGNLVDALALSVDSPNAAGKTFMISDGEDFSTPELISRIAAALGVRSRLLPLPPAAIRFLGRLTGKVSQTNRLLQSLQVDSRKIRNELGWTPPFHTSEGLMSVATWYSKL